MKYGHLLGTGPVLIGRSLRSANIQFRTFRCLPTLRICKVTYFSSHNNSATNAYRFCPRRRVSTGPRKSQMAVVGLPSKISVMPPNPLEINKFISSVPGKNKNRCRSNVVSPKIPQNIPPLITVGEFLETSTSCSKNILTDPFVVESAFLPTFHSFQEEFRCIFGHKPVLNVDPKVSSSTKQSDEHVTDQSGQTSWDGMPWKPLDVETSQCPDNSKREVKKELVFPRDLKHPDSQERLQTFLDVHRFDESDAKNKEKKDISGFPLGGDTTIPFGRVIIQSDRSSFIINKDLYITNRILDKLKKRDKEPSTDGQPSQPVAKAAPVADDHIVSKQTPLSVEILSDQILHAKRTEIPENAPRPAHRSKSDTFLTPAWTYLSPAPREESVSENPVPDASNPFREISRSISRSSLPSKDVLENKDLTAPGKFPINVEFANPPLDRLSPLEFEAFESRKNLYKRLLRNTPCYLVDGLHIENGCEKDLNDKLKLPVDSFNKGDSEEISQTTYLPTKFEETNPWDFSIRCDREQDHIFEQPDLEEWFVPLGNEIDSMLSALSAQKSNCRDIDVQLSLNQENQKQVDAHQDSMDFKDCVDHIGDSVISDVERVDLDNGMVPFEGFEDINSVVSKSNNNPAVPGSGLVRYNSSSTSQKSTIPPKQNNPNVDIKTETTIKCCRSGDNTDINVIETQRYLDKRLPYPFSTETVLQVCGTNDSLYKATQAVENSKSQLVHLSNANTPNPGMVIPKLQFNHMLSKTHELTNQNSSNKKRVLKIKIVPETGSHSSPPSESLSEPSSVSHVLHAPKQPSSSVNRETVDLQKKSKYPHKTTSRKIRRSESGKHLRSRKKNSSDDVGENVTVLSPKDLERMFPAPPKPKPVEKPRNVTVNNKAAKTNDSYNISNLVTAPVSVSKITLKTKKSKDQWLLVKKKSELAKSIDSEAKDKVPPASVKVEKEQAVKKLGKVDREAGLSSRDQKILKSIISHKVKDGFTAVSQRSKNIKNDAAHDENSSEMKKPISQQSKHADNKMEQKAVAKAVETEKSLSPTRKAKTELFESLFEGHKHSLSPPTRYEAPSELRSSKIPSSIEVPPGQAVDKKQVSKRDISPTPPDNRDYITINKIDDEKNPRVPKKSQTPEPPKTPTRKFSEGLVKEDTGRKVGVIQPTMGSIIPLKPKVIDASESTPNRINDASRANPSKPKSAFSSVKRVARSGIEKHFNKPDFNSLQGNLKSKFTESSKFEVKGMKAPKGNMKRLEKEDLGKNVHELQISAQQPKKQWQPHSEPTLFPFETPTVKELEQNISTPHGKSLPTPPSSSDPQTYEVDFCKMRTESNPGLDVFSQALCKVPLSRMKEFPMINESKTGYSAPKNFAISIKHNTDEMLRRTLSQMPAVTKVLGATLSAKSQQALERWKQGLVSTLGEEGFNQFVQNQLREGSNFHSTVGKLLLNKIDCKDDLCLKSMSNVFPHITDVSVVESQVVHPQLGYRGVVDCVAKYKGKPVVLEWKRSDKFKPTIKHTYDAPVQLSAYVGALNFDNNYNSKIEGGVVVVAYSDGSPADVFEIPLEECQHYWTKWLKRLHRFYSRT